MTKVLLIDLAGRYITETGKSYYRHDAKKFTILKAIIKKNTLNKKGVNFKVSLERV